MARRKKQDAETTPKPAGNGFDPAHVKQAVGRIEILKREIESIMGTAMEECRRVHEDIAIIYQEAKDEHGIPKKALKSVIKARELERKAAAVRDDLEPEVQNDHDMIRHALGDFADTPLGRAALGEQGSAATAPAN